MMDHAREFGFEDKSWSDLRNWWQTKRADCPAVEPPVAAAPAEPAPTACDGCPRWQRPSRQPCASRNRRRRLPGQKSMELQSTKPIAPIAASVPATSGKGGADRSQRCWNRPSLDAQGVEGAKAVFGQCTVWWPKKRRSR